MRRSIPPRVSATLGFVLAVSLVAFAPAVGTSRADAPLRTGIPAIDVEQAAHVLQFENLLRTVQIAHDKFTALAGAMPESEFAWRPMDGVLAVSEVYIHIAADNFFVPSLMGLEAPAETGVTDDVRTFRAYQEREMTKIEIIEAVDASFEFLLGAMEETREELDRTMTLGSSDTTVGDVWIRAVTHIHEHLGQSIAYARTNEVVPPWSG